MGARLIDLHDPFAIAKLRQAPHRPLSAAAADGIARRRSVGDVFAE